MDVADVVEKMVCHDTGQDGGNGTLDCLILFLLDAGCQGDQIVILFVASASTGRFLAIVIRIVASNEMSGRDGQRGKS